MEHRDLRCSICGEALVEAGRREYSRVALPGGGWGWSDGVAMQCPHWAEHVAAWERKDREQAQ